MQETIPVHDGERIAYITCYGPTAQFPIPIWRVFMKDDSSIGLFLLDPSQFSGKDKDALEYARRRSEELSQKRRESVVNSTNNNVTCCGCQII
jgi:hypothetical protein